jgi:hypothetical protein
MHHDNIGKANARDRLHLAHEIEGRRNQKLRVAVGDGAQLGLGRDIGTTARPGSRSRTIGRAFSDSHCPINRAVRSAGPPGV